MATLETLRNRAGVLVAIVIGLALLAFILGDLFGSGGSLFTRNQYEIAEINGKSIPYQVYQQRIDFLSELNKASRGQSALDEQTMESIREEVWNELIRDNVLGNKYAGMGIAVSTDELFDMVQGRNIHPIIRQEFGNPQTGEVDPAFVVQFLQNLDADPSGLQKQVWLYIESLIIQDRLFTKYNHLVAKGLHTTNLHASKLAGHRSKNVDFTYVVSKYASLNDSLFPVSESDVKAYYNSHKNEFKQDASRDVEYVVFPIEPSADDYTAAQEWINDIQADFIAASDPIQFTNLNSDRPFNPSFYAQGTLPYDELDNWAFSARTGDYVGPLQIDNSFIIARLVKTDNLPDSVKARHILITPEGGTELDYFAAKNKADSLYAIVRSSNFAEIAKENSHDFGSAVEGGDLGWFPEGVMVKPFNDACFEGKKGEIVLIETQFGFHIIEIQDRGVLSKKVQVAILERNVTPSTRTYQRVYQQASEFAGKNRTYADFNQAVQENKLAKRVASSLRKDDRRVVGLENPREMVRWAYQSKAGEVSSVFEFGDNFVVAALKTVREEGYAPIAQVRDYITTEVLREKKAQKLSSDMKAVVSNATSMESVASGLALNAQYATHISFASYSIPQEGIEPEVIAVAVNSSEGEIVGPIQGNSGVYVLSVTATNEEEIDVEFEKARLISQYLNQAYREAYEAVKKNAKIEDNRSKFF